MIKTALKNSTDIKSTITDVSSSLVTGSKKNMPFNNVSIAAIVANSSVKFKYGLL